MFVAQLSAGPYVLNDKAGKNKVSINRFWSWLTMKRGLCSIFQKLMTPKIAKLNFQSRENGDR